MNQFHAGNIKNIALAGHHSSGKTSLAEALLHSAGASDRFGKTTDGTTVCDFDPEEIKRKSSLSTALAGFAYEENWINLLDTPGILDFAGEQLSGIAAADTVLITVSAKSGVRVGTKKAYAAAQSMGKSTMFAITKIDDKDANFYNTLTELKTVFGPTVCPVVVPIIEKGEITGFINLIEMKAYQYDAKGKAAEIAIPDEVTTEHDYRLEGLKTAITEAVAETDEVLMEKFFEGEEFTQKELIDGIHAGMNKGLISPVVCTSAATLAGVDMLLKEFGLLVPAANEVASTTADDGDDMIEITCDPSAPLAALVCKTVADPFVGKMSYIKVLSGTLSADAAVTNARTGAEEKIGKLYTLLGKKQTEVKSAEAGDIVAAVKIGALTGDTLCSPDRVASAQMPEFPRPCYAMAVRAKNQGDESKVSAGMARITEEDPTLSYQQDPNTKEQVLSGLGDQHLEIAVARLSAKFGAEVKLAEPQIAYRETIRKKVEAEGKHKKQSGGHGQYGHVKIAFEPCVSDELVFEEKVFGGSVPKNYFPAVEKGLQECVRKGVLAGCPVVGVKAILLDGSYHPVDSSEMAFKMAASIAYKEGMRSADPVMLEPISTLVVTVPDENTGDIMGELNKRRGRVLGMEPAAKGETAITAEVPNREMHDFALYLRQVTRGMGSFTLEFLRYEPLPANLLSEVIAAIAVNAEA